MFNVKSLVVLGLLGMAFNVVAAQQGEQDSAKMTPPKPVENKVFDSMVGTWHAKSTDMMGQKMSEVLTAKWALNHQFLIFNLKATAIDKPKMTYEGMGVFGIDANSKVKSSWFDSWGAESMGTGTGEFNGNMLTLTSSNPNYKETRTFEVKGNEMTMHAKGAVTKNGKETPFDVTTVYKKK